MTRKEAIKRAMSSMMLEGFVYTLEEKEIFEKIGDGELDMDYIDQFVEKKLEQLRKERPEIFLEKCNTSTKFKK